VRSVGREVAGMCRMCPASGCVQFPAALLLEKSLRRRLHAKYDEEGLLGTHVPNAAPEVHGEAIPQVRPCKETEHVWVSDPMTRTNFH